MKTESPEFQRREWMALLLGLVFATAGLLVLIYSPDSYEKSVRQLLAALLTLFATGSFLGYWVFTVSRNHKDSARLIADFQKK